MARTVAPLLSFGASGAIAKTQVYAKWKGRPYARRYVVPANPNTTAQQAVRNTFGWLNNVWKYMLGAAVAGWTAYGDVSQFTARNGWLKINVSNLIGQADLTDFIFSPSARSGLIAPGVTVTPGAGQLTVTPDEPSLPTGWSINSATAAAIKQQDPASGVDFQVFAATDAATPFAPVITGLTAAATYVVGAWFEFTKANGDLAYGQSIMSTGIPT